jgi:hypothetical protein
MQVLDVIAYTGFTIGVIALPVLIYNWFAYVVRRARASPSARREIRMPIRSILFFSIPVLVTLAVGETSKYIGHDQVMRTLEAFRADYQVAVNGTPAENPDQILAMLKTLHWIFPHHSSPTRRITLEISDPSHRLVLWACRDSGDPREYWVFYPKYLITAHNQVGRIVTPIFDAY